MDLVEGPNLDELVRTQALPPRAAAGHVETIARAIEYAHGCGVLHRDLKPSNVLIDADGVPRVTDFGLAKRFELSSPNDAKLASEGSSQPRTDELTQAGEVLGSPNFMPPEQVEASRGPVGAASDIYSLGALLYHLLTGRPPFVAASVVDTLRLVLHEEPVSPRLLNPAVPRDLETICLHCLEKDPARRYPTALTLAEELGRFLRHEPILARPIGRPQRLWRWCCREPRLAGLTAGLGLVVASGLIVTSLLLWRERAARLRAQRAEDAQSGLRLVAERQANLATAEASKSRQLAEFLQQMLSKAGPSASLGRDTTLLREILDQAAQRIDRELTNQPAAGADLRDVLGRTYADIGDAGKSVALHREALRLREQSGTGRTADGARTQSLLARALADAGNLDEAEALNRSAMNLWRELNGPEDPKVANCLNNLGNVFFRRGNLARARECFEQALAIYRRVRDANTSAPLHNLGNVLALQRDYAGAEKYYREAIALARQEHGDRHPTTALYLRNLGDVLHAQGRLTEASAVHSEALATRTSLLDEVHPLVADSMERLAAVQYRAGRWKEAETLFRQALTVRRKLAPNDPTEWGDDANSLIETLNAQHRQPDAVQRLNELLGAVPPDDARAARLYAIRGSTLARGGRWVEAIPDLQKAARFDPTNYWYTYLLGPLLAEAGDANGYAAFSRRTLQVFGAAGGDISSQVAFATLLRLDSTNELPTVRAMVDRSLLLESRRGGRWYDLSALALVELRSGQAARASERMQSLLADVEAGRVQAGRFARVLANTILALAECAGGRKTESLQALQTARTVAPGKIQKPADGDYGGSWHEWLILQILLRESSAAIERAGAVSDEQGAGNPR